MGLNAITITGTSKVSRDRIVCPFEVIDNLFRTPSVCLFMMAKKKNSSIHSDVVQLLCLHKILLAQCNGGHPIITSLTCACMVAALAGIHSATDIR